jgi:hypothetical protein
VVEPLSSKKEALVSTLSTKTRQTKKKQNKTAYHLPQKNKVFPFLILINAKVVI